jgi:hypothetical protein
VKPITALRAMTAAMDHPLVPLPEREGQGRGRREETNDQTPELAGQDEPGAPRADLS